jgi:hypothetical protein
MKKYILGGLSDVLPILGMELLSVSLCRGNAI